MIATYLTKLPTSFHLKVANQLLAQRRRLNELTSYEIRTCVVFPPQNKTKNRLSNLAFTLLQL